MIQEPIRLSVVLPAYDSLGRLHDGVFAVREWLLHRPGPSEMLLVSRKTGIDRRFVVSRGRVEESVFPVSRGSLSLAGAVGNSRGRTVLLMDPDILHLLPVAERLVAWVEAGWDVSLATPATFPANDISFTRNALDPDPDRDPRGLSFAAYGGAVARRIAAAHATQDFGAGDEHLYLVSDSELRVYEEEVAWPVDRKEPLSFSGILSLFRSAQAGSPAGTDTAPGWTPSPRAA